MALNCRRGVRHFGHMICRPLRGSGGDLLKGEIYVGGKSIEGRYCNMIDPGLGFLQLKSNNAPFNALLRRTIWKLEVWMGTPDSLRGRFCSFIVSAQFFDFL
ncbi:hypothetical protein KC19_11G130800 [Ceratodon purpureus]|uniref:Uncharacterized protein n=1 Tax=Ceratodon purpureus TaxID=3225 RepID=A0A8T0GDF4_CERPU|nr:hypothetical protein KC19_11G130800 [Ceratodon purpureus]